MAVFIAKQRSLVESWAKHKPARTQTGRSFAEAMDSFKKEFWVEIDARTADFSSALQQGIDRLLAKWPQQEAVNLRIRDEQGTIEIKTEKPKDGQRRGRAGLGDVFRYIRIYWRPYLGAGVLILGSMLSFQLFQTAFAYSLKVIVDGALAGAAVSTVVPIIGGLLLAFPLVAVISIYGERITARVSSRIANDIRLDIFDHLQQLSLDFYKQARLGDILARFSSDLDVVERGVATRLAPGVVAIVSVAINTAVLFYLQWQLALATIVLLPFVYPLLEYLTPRAADSQYKMKRQEAQMVNAVQENVRAQSLIKSFGIQTWMRGRFQGELTQLAERNVSANFDRALVETSSVMSLFFVELVITSIGALLVFNGALTAGSLLAYTAILSALNRDLYDILRRTYPHLIAAAGGARRIEELLHTQPTVREHPDAGTLSPFSEAIRFEDVTFSYTGHQPHLADVSLTINKGSFVAFVGSSGAGKSTIFNLLLRFYDVGSGRITYDGQDIREVTLASLRSQMGVVLQETFLFNASILDNIRVARPQATEAEVIAAAKAAELHEFILSLPDGYQTAAGEAGGQISGGQRQRVAIARALLYSPQILLFDEPMTALDNETAAEITATIERLAHNHTIIMISHHLPSVSNADQIFVLENGRILEHGTHSDLLATGQTYYELWQASQND